MSQHKGGPHNEVSVIVRDKDETVREIGVIYRYHPFDGNFPENPNYLRLPGPLGVEAIVVHPYSLNLMRPVKLKARAHHVYERLSMRDGLYEPCEPKPIIEIQLSTKPVINKYELLEDHSIMRRSTQFFIEVEAGNLALIAALISDPYFVPV